MAEGTSDMVEVQSEHDSGCDLDDNLYQHFNYSSYTKKKEFLECKMGERKSKMGNGKSKIGRFIEQSIIGRKKSKFCQGLVASQDSSNMSAVYARNGRGLRPMGVWSIFSRYAHRLTIISPPTLKIVSTPLLWQ